MLETCNRIGPRSQLALCVGSLHLHTSHTVAQQVSDPLPSVRHYGASRHFLLAPWCSSLNCTRAKDIKQKIAHIRKPLVPMKYLWGQAQPSSLLVVNRHLWVNWQSAQLSPLFLTPLTEPPRPFEEPPSSVSLKRQSLWIRGQPARLA